MFRNSLNYKGKVQRKKNLRWGCLGSSVIEYIVLSVIVISTIFMMKDPIIRGVSSKYKSSGDSFAFGRQYNPRRTTVCRQDVINYDSAGNPNMGPFYDEDCYYAKVMGPNGCPQCNPEDINCLNCEDAIKVQCSNGSYCNQ